MGINPKQQIINTLEEEHPDFRSLTLHEWIETPSDPSHGDFALPCFKLASIQQKDPNDIASDLCENLPVPNGFQQTTAVGPYLNFELDRAPFIQDVCTEIHTNFSSWSQPDVGNGETIVIDYSSPNISKPPHIGHLRPTVLGSVLYRLYDQLGFQPVGVNHLGDWGTPMGKLLLAYEEWGDPQRLEDDGVSYLEELYVKITRKCEEDDTLQKKAKSKFQQLEKGDPETVERWETFKSLSIDHLKELYELLNVSFDEYKGESYYSALIPEVFEQLNQHNLIKESEGAKVIPLEEHDLPPFLLEKADGSTLYSTRDLAAALHRREHHGAEHLMYVVAAEQNLHFRQLFHVLEKMELDWADNCTHVDFGLIHFEGKKMSTREGTAVSLEELLETGIEQAKSIMEDRSFAPDKTDEIAREIGVGAVVFRTLHTRRNRHIEFDWDEAIGYDPNTGSFRGETGPYLQYSHVRICGILREFEGDIPESFHTDPLTDHEEFMIVRKLSKYPEILVSAQQQNEPARLTNYLIELAQKFHTYYHDREAHQIISDNEDLTEARVGLCQCIKRVLADGMKILGLRPLEKM